jgi:hypothetical protein
MCGKVTHFWELVTSLLSYSLPDSPHCSFLFSFTFPSYVPPCLLSSLPPSVPSSLPLSLPSSLSISLPPFFLLSLPYFLPFSFLVRVSLRNPGRPQTHEAPPFTNAGIYRCVPPHLGLLPFSIGKGMRKGNED